MLSFLYWYAVAGPVWLAQLAWNIQRFLLRYFSVPVMLKTLVSHWRKDAVVYRGGTVSGILLTFAWNQISRGVGLIIRTSVLAISVMTASAAAAVSIGVFVSFLLWPAAAVGGIVAGVIGIISS
jgi:hypothetical protein